MARILITWELGSGLGHLVPLRSLVRQLVGRGHAVTLAARDLMTAGVVFQNIPIRFLQAPHRIEPFKPPFDPPATYNHLLHNISFGSVDGLYAMASAWQAIFSAVRPDLILFEHSPTAMFAARSLAIRSATIGTGFTAPTIPLPVIRPWLTPDLESWRQDAFKTVQIANEVAARLQLPSLNSLDDLYQRCDATFLLTYPELDHFGPRENAHYIGIERDAHGGKPKWPYGDGPKIFAYLKSFSGFREAVAQIYQLRLPSIVFCPGQRPQEVRELEEAFPSLAFAVEPLNLELVMRDCALVVCHGSHGMIARTLLAGVPLVAIPLQLEQALLCHRLNDSGAGIQLTVDKVSQLSGAIQHLLSCQSFANAAKQFAQKYAGHGDQQNGVRLVDWIEAG